MSFTGDVKILRFFNLGWNTGDMIYCSLSVELYGVLFDRMIGDILCSGDF